MDANFYRQALAGGEKEIRMSRLALSRSKNPHIKRLAQTMILDHGALDSRMTAVSRIGPVPVANAGTVAELATMSGPQFDRRYLAVLLSDHRDAIALFQDASRNARSDATRRLAANALPKLREHLGAVQHTVQVVNEVPRPQ